MRQQTPLQNFVHHPNRLMMLVDEHINEASEYLPHEHEWGQIIFVNQTRTTGR